LSFKHGGFHDTCLEYELDWNLAPSVTRELEVRPPEYSGEPRNYAISVQRIRVQSPDSYELRAVFELEDSRKLLPWGSPPPIRAPNAGGATVRLPPQPSAPASHGNRLTVVLTDGARVLMLSKAVQGAPEQKIEEHSTD
jgi:hypothetical protein